MARPEDIFQEAVAPYLDAVLPEDAFFTAVDKAGKRSPIQGAHLKRRGIKSGVPDILLWWRGLGYCIELKSAVGHLSESQRVTFPKMTRAGVQISMARTMVEVRRALIHWAIPLRYHALDAETRDMMWQARLTKRTGRAPKLGKRAQECAVRLFDKPVQKSSKSNRLTNKPSKRALAFALRAQAYRGVE